MSFYVITETTPRHLALYFYDPWKDLYENIFPGSGAETDLFEKVLTKIYLKFNKWVAFYLNSLAYLREAN